ncbi:hypothetical protein Tco_0707829, partial [Tanacetum coccineum]
GLQIKQMEEGIFFNQSKYIKEMLKKFGLEDSKPTKTPMSTEIKLTKEDEADSVDSSKYRGTGIETIVYADSDHTGDYVDRKSTSGVCTFMGCCLTYWFAKKQTALAISMTEAEYVFAGKACQQALWMKQALIDYGIRLDDVLIMCDNKGAIELSIKMPSEYQQDYKKTCAYAPKIYYDPNMPDALRDIYRTLESRYVHEGRIINPSFYNDLSDDLVAKFTAIGFDCLLSLDEQICPRTVHKKVDNEGNTIHKLPNQIETNELFNHLGPCELVIKENVYSAIGNRDHTQAVIALMLYCLETRQPFNLAYFIIRRMYFFRDRKDKVLPYGMILTCLFRNLKANLLEHLFNARYKRVPRKMSSLKAKQPKRPPLKRARNVGKSKRTQLSTSSLTELPPSDNEDLPSTKLSPRSYSMALKDDPNMSKEQRETKGMFKTWEENCTTLQDC